MKHNDEKANKRLEDATERAFNRCNLEGENCDVWGVLMRYKAIRELPEAEIDKIYDQIVTGLGFKGGKSW